MVNSRTKGLTAERAVANYLKDNGFPDARRSVATGWSNGSSELGDHGDIDGVPPFALQVKNLARRLEGKLLTDTWNDACRQALSMMELTKIDTYALIIEKRAGTADVGRWWVHTTNKIYTRAITGRWHWLAGTHMVRVELGSIVTDLRVWSNELAN